MSTPAIARFEAFEERFTLAQASEVVEFPWGYAVLQEEFPLSHYHNRIVVTSAVRADQVIQTCERVLGGAGLGHRYVSTINDDLGRAVTAQMIAAGFEHEPVAALRYPGQPSGRVGDGPAVEVVSLQELRPALIADWRGNLPNADQEVFVQLADRTALYKRAAEHLRLAIRADGSIAAHGDLFIHRSSGIAQFENLVTQPAFRKRGFGAALVRDALVRGSEEGCDVLALTASIEDWPYQWYRRLGYTEIGRTHHFSRNT